MPDFVVLLPALIFLVLWIQEQIRSNHRSNSLTEFYNGFIQTLLQQKDVQLNILDEQSRNQAFILQRENEILREENRDLLNRVKAADLMAYQQLSKLTSTEKEPYVPRDDESEYNTWKQAVQSGVGSMNTEVTEIDDGIVSEAIELGIIAGPGDEAGLFGTK